MKLISNKTLILTCITALMMTFSMSSYAKIYKWVDNKGQTHYTATPPPSNQAKSDAENIEKDIKANAGKYQAPRENAEEKASETKKHEPRDVPLAGPSPQLIKFCDSKRKNLKFLQDNFRVLWTDERGEQTRFSQEQREEKIKSLQDEIRDDCADVPPSATPET